MHILYIIWHDIIKYRQTQKYLGQFNKYRSAQRNLEGVSIYSYCINFLITWSYVKVHKIEINFYCCKFYIDMRSRRPFLLYANQKKLLYVWSVSNSISQPMNGLIQYTPYIIHMPYIHDPASKPSKFFIMAIL